MARADGHPRRPLLTAAEAPSGEQVEVAHGDQRAVVVTVGGGLREYTVGDRRILDGYASDELCTSGRGQLLVPWPNRIDNGAYEFDGRRYQLALDEPEHGNAIHGLVRWAQWSVVEREPHRAALEYRLHPTPGYPFTLALRVEYALAEEGLAARMEASNLGPTACPYGAGAHPYLALGPGGADAAELKVPAAAVVHADERGIPRGRADVGGTDLDFREPRPIGDVRLDHCFTELERDGDGKMRVVAGDTTLWADEAHPFVMVFTGDPLPDVARRSVAVEPMTCAPNAFRSGEGLIRLEPGNTHVATWGIEP